MALNFQQKLAVALTHDNIVWNAPRVAMSSKHVTSSRALHTALSALADSSRDSSVFSLSGGRPLASIRSSTYLNTTGHDRSATPEKSPSCCSRVVKIAPGFPRRLERSAPRAFGPPGPGPNTLSTVRGNGRRLPNCSGAVATFLPGCFFLCVTVEKRHTGAGRATYCVCMLLVNAAPGRRCAAPQKGEIATAWSGTGAPLHVTKRVDRASGTA